MNKNKSLLSISFAKGFKSPNLPIATFTQNNKDLNFIIDTGSDDNVINKQALDEIEHERIEHEGTIAGVGGVFDVEACNITFQYEGDTFTEKFLIADHLKDAFDDIKRAHAIHLHGMLGSKFLMEHNIVMDFNNMIAYNRK